MSAATQRSLTAPMPIDTEAAIARVIASLPVPGKSCEEAKIAAWVIEQLRALGITDSQIRFDRAHEKTRRRGEVGNLFVHLPGNLPGPTRMFSAHLDTVPICEGCQPLREGDEVRSANPATGIGADNRTGVSVLLTIIAELKRQMLSHPPLLFCWFVQEEIGLEGSRHLDPLDLSGIAWCCNFDGSSPEKITIGATGGERMEITVHGRASHAGVSPRDGISAIVIASRAIAWLHEGGWLGAIDQPQGKGTANVGVIRGGDATNVVTPEVTIRAEARSHDRAFRQVISDTIIAAFERSASVVKNQKQEAGRVTVSRHVDYDPFRIDETDPVVVAARAAIEAQGREPQLKISDGGLDANWLYRHGVKAVTLGCGQREPHTVSERLNLPDYLTACAAALTMATMPLES